MKKIIYLAILLIAVKAEAQKGVVFKMKYLPNHTYNGTATIALDCRVDLSGNDTIISKIKEQGVSIPVTAELAMKIKGNIKTGKTGADGQFPVAIKFNFDDLSVNVGGKQIPVPMDKIKTAVNIYGHADRSGKLKADSIGGAKLSDTAEEKISKMMEIVQKNIKFPDHPMKIGESFTQDMPLSLPAAGNNMNIDSKVVYKLVNITAGIAYFDVVQSMNLTIPIQGDAINLSGSGTGKLIYSIKDEFATDYSSDVNLKITGNIKTLKIDASAKMTMEYKYDIN
jgi:hypothetical protein